MATLYFIYLDPRLGWEYVCPSASSWVLSLFYFLSISKRFSLLIELFRKTDNGKMRFKLRGALRRKLVDSNFTLDFK